MGQFGSLINDNLQSEHLSGYRLIVVKFDIALSRLDSLPKVIISLPLMDRVSNVFALLT